MTAPHRAGTAGTSPMDPADAGAEGNSRLTSVTGTVLLVMLAVEGYTVLDVRGLITLHIFLGLMLVGPVALKTVSTLYRFSRYYTDHAAYVRRGPPHIVLRVLGPLVTLFSLALLGTGIGLVTVHHGDAGFLLTAHKASFFGWVAVMTVHVLGHVREALTTSWSELRRRSGSNLLRLGVVTAAILIGLGLAATVFPSFHSWTSQPVGFHHSRP